MIEARCKPSYYGGFSVMLFTHFWFSAQTAFYRKETKRVRGFSLPPLPLVTRDFIMMIFKKKVLKLPSMVRGNSFTFNHSCHF